MTHTRIIFGLVLSMLVGCRPPASKPATPSASDASGAQRLRLLVIDDEEMARTIERQWTAHGAEPLQVRVVSQEEFQNKPQRRLAADVVIYPTALMGELAGRDWLQPLGERESSNAEFQWQDIWELPRLQEIKWGSATMAVPLGSPTLMLCYRPDVFERLSLSVPKTWEEYQAVVTKLSLKDEKGNESWNALEPIGGGWAGELLLARAASYAKHPSQYSTLFDYRDMKPLINGPPFVRALEELVAAQKAALPSDSNWEQLRKSQNVDEVRLKLLDGHGAIGITWPGPTPGENTTAAAFPLAFAPLPGSADVYNFRTSMWEQPSGNAPTSVPLLGVSGRCASITKESHNASTAMTFLFFVAGPELSGQISSASKQTTLFRNSHLTQIDRWLGTRYGQESAKKYAETAEQIFNQSSGLVTLRIVGRSRYLSALDDAVWSSITGKTAAKDALQNAAEQWDKITDELGRDAQRKAYSLSIGLEP